MIGLLSLPGDLALLQKKKKEKEKLHFICKYAIFSPHMATNIQVEKHTGESTANLLRRFTKRVRSAGILTRMRGIRYYERSKSENVHKFSKLRKLARAAEFEKNYKLGKVELPTFGRKK